MKGTLFRQKNMDSISSPDQLDDYVRVTSPSVWVVLGALILLLGGICCWSIFGALETTVTAPALDVDGHLVLYLSEDIAKTVGVNDEIRTETGTGKIISISEKPLSFAQVCEKLGQDEYTIYTMGIESQRFLYEVTADLPGLSEKIITAEIITETVKPMTFVLN